MKKKFCKTLFLAVFLFLYYSNLFPSIISGTLISTPDGLMPIESLQVGDAIIGYDSNNGIVHTKIAMITRKEIETVVIVETKKENLYTSEKQKFYDPTLQQWVAAKNITKDTMLVDCYSSYIPCINVETVQKKMTAYEVSLETPHTFFIESTQILTHNVVPVFTYAIASPVVAPAISYTAAMISSAATGVALFLSKLFFVSRYQKRCRFENSLQHKTISRSTQQRTKNSTDKNSIIISSFSKNTETMNHGGYIIVKPKKMSLKKCLALYNIPINLNKAREQYIREKKLTEKRKRGKQKSKGHSKNGSQPKNYSNSPKPEDPNKKPNKNNDDKDNKSENEQKFEIKDRFAQHIFRNEEGHLPYDTPENRKLLFDLVSDQKNFLVKDIHGTKWYGKTLPNGKQLWATTRGYLIRNGGLNDIPKTPNSITGLSRVFPPNSKL